MENTALLVEYEELLRYCPMLVTDRETAQSLDRHTLQVLSMAARSNCADRRELQRQGIEQAKAHGVKFGRPKAKIPRNFNNIVEAWQNGEITREEAARQSGLSQSSFYRYVRKLQQN